MKWFKLALIVLAITLAVSVSTAQAGRMYLSLSSTSPIAEEAGQINPTLNLAQGASGSLYMWWLPATDSTGSGREELTNFSHDIVSSNPILTKTGGTYLIDNPSGRWQSTNNIGNTAAAATYIWDN